MKQKRIRWNLMALLTAACLAGAGMNSVAATKDGKTLFIACATANQVAAFDVAGGKIAKTIALSDPPLGLALSSDQGRLYVACAALESTVAVIDTAKGKVL